MTNNPVVVAAPAFQLRFEDIYLQYRARIHCCLVRFVGRDMAEDLTQDVFLRVSQALPRLSHDAPLEAWLYRIATNAAYDALRHHRLIRWTTLDDLGEGPNSDVNGDPQDKYNGSSELINAVLAQMAPLFRRVLLLNFQGYTFAEIGRAIDASPSATKVRLCRARQQFGQIYQKLASREVAA